MLNFGLNTSVLSVPDKLCHFKKANKTMKLLRFDTVSLAHSHWLCMYVTWEAYQIVYSYELYLVIVVSFTFHTFKHTHSMLPCVAFLWASHAMNHKTLLEMPFVRLFTINTNDIPFLAYVRILWTCLSYTLLSSYSFLCDKNMNENWPTRIEWMVFNRHIKYFTENNSNIAYNT